MDENFYNWIFNSDNTIFCAYDKEKIIGGYCLLELSCHINSNKIRLGLCNNVFINGFKYLKLNTFKSLSEYALEIFNREGGIAIGFPNPKSFQSHMRVGWDSPINIKILKIDKTNVDVLEFNKGSAATRTLDEYALSNMSRILGSHNNLDFSISKDLGFLKWRYLNNPRYEYFYSYSETDESFITWKFFSSRSRIHILDLYVASKKGIENCLKEVSKFSAANEINFSQIDLWCPPIYQPILLEIGFNIDGDQTFIFKNLTGNQLNINFSRSYVSLSDNDVF